jgi:hypothetical protein
MYYNDPKLMKYEDLLEHIAKQHPDMQIEVIREIASAMQEEASTVYVGG